MAKKFFSFLGRGTFNKDSGVYGYNACVYEFAGKRSEKTEFVQEAIIKNVLPQFSAEDKICIFVTPQVREENWKKLEPLLSAAYSQNLKPVFIDDFKTEADIWTLFNALYDNIEQGDEVFLDITHSFRYLPMLYLSVLNYAQYLKNITVSGIYYGAFEAGETSEDGTLVAPIFDLSDLFEAMRWANAADLFVNYGVAKRVKQIVSQTPSASPLLSKLSESIEKISENMNYSRGQRIVEGKMFADCIHRIADYKASDEKKNPALIPILDSVVEKVGGFSTDDALNFLPAVSWYIDHDMPAEAISMMKEGVISYLITSAHLDYKKTQLRLILGKRLAKSRSYNYDEKDNKFSEAVEHIMQNPMADEIKPIIERFNFLRGNRTAIEAKRFKKIFLIFTFLCQSLSTSVLLYKQEGEQKMAHFTVQPGDIVFARRSRFHIRNLYRHYGVHVGGGRVVHFTGLAGHETDPRLACIQETSLGQFLAGDEGGVEPCGTAYPRAEVVRRATATVGRGRGLYGLVLNNCEQFALWCATGEYRSAQVEKAATRVLGRRLGHALSGYAQRVAAHRWGAEMAA